MRLTRLAPQQRRTAGVQGSALLFPFQEGEADRRAVEGVSEPVGLTRTVTAVDITSEKVYMNTSLLVREYLFAKALELTKKYVAFQFFN